MVVRVEGRGSLLGGGPHALHDGAAHEVHRRGEQPGECMPHEPGRTPDLHAPRDPPEPVAEDAEQDPARCGIPPQQAGHEVAGTPQRAEAQVAGGCGEEHERGNLFPLLDEEPRDLEGHEPPVAGAPQVVGAAGLERTDRLEVSTCHLLVGRRRLPAVPTAGCDGDEGHFRTHRTGEPEAVVAGARVVPMQVQQGRASRPLLDRDQLTRRAQVVGKDPLRQSCDRRLREDPVRGRLDVQLGLDAGEQDHGGEGVSPQLDEVVVYPDGRDGEQLLPNGREVTLQRAPWLHVGRAAAWTLTSGGR